MRIALVDNDPAFLRSLEVLLTEQGHQVRCFQKPAEALGPEALWDAHVVLVDLVMPGLSGLDVVARLRVESHPTPMVILVSGHTDQVEGVDLEARGIHAFLPKPVDLEALNGLLRSPLARRLYAASPSHQGDRT